MLAGRGSVLCARLPGDHQDLDATSSDVYWAATRRKMSPKHAPLLHVDHSTDRLEAASSRNPRMLRCTESGFDKNFGVSAPHVLALWMSYSIDSQLPNPINLHYVQNPFVAFVDREQDLLIDACISAWQELGAQRILEVNWCALSRAGSGAVLGGNPLSGSKGATPGQCSGESRYGACPTVEVLATMLSAKPFPMYPSCREFSMTPATGPCV